MRVGIGIAMLNLGTEPDQVLYRDAIRLAELGEEHGFDSAWAVEHHFTGHSPTPNPLQLLAFLASHTRRLRLGTAVIVLPWHDPIRVAEEIAMLDNLAPGRVVAGFGRGASEVEYAGFGISPDESRARFREAAEIVSRALTEERIAYRGRFYDVPEVSIRPRPVAPVQLYASATSPESAAVAGALGLGALVAPLPEPAATARLLAEHAGALRKAGSPDLPPIGHTYVCIAPSDEEAQTLARRHVAPMLGWLQGHYRGKDGTHPARRDQLPAGETAAAEQAFLDRHVIGTPAACLERIAQICRHVPLGEFIAELSFGGMPQALVHRNVRLFADEVLPVLHDARSFP